MLHKHPGWRLEMPQDQMMVSRWLMIIKYCFPLHPPPTLHPHLSPFINSTPRESLHCRVPSNVQYIPTNVEMQTVLVYLLTSSIIWESSEWLWGHLRSYNLSWCWQGVLTGLSQGPSHAGPPCCSLIFFFCCCCRCRATAQLPHALGSLTVAPNIRGELQPSSSQVAESVYLLLIIRQIATGGSNPYNI